MIDTICLLIPLNKLSFVKGVPRWDLFSKTNQYAKYVRNPNKTEKGMGLYFPRLTGYRRQYTKEVNVRIEFSAPKLLFQNNLDELENKDFSKLIITLQNRLQILGLEVSKEVLEEASISSVHFSKNILLKDGYTATHLISEMSKVNLRKSFDFAKTRFVNDGQSLYAHATSHQFVIYDKIADLGKDKNRAIDKEQTLYQISLFPDLSKKETLEVLRFEIRLSHKQKMNKILEKLGYKRNPTLKDIFDSEVSLKVISYYWETVIKKGNLGLFSLSIGPKEILQTLLLNDKNVKPKQAVYLIGLYLLAKDENGIRQLRTIFSKRSKDRTWYRMVGDLKEADQLITKNIMRNWVTQIDNALEKYQPYILEKRAL